MEHLQERISQLTKRHEEIMKIINEENTISATSVCSLAKELEQIGGILFELQLINGSAKIKSND